MVALDDIVESITPGVGDGDGVGVGVGDAVGVGVGVGGVVAGVGVRDCASAGEIMPIASTEATTVDRASARPAITHSTRDEQRIHFHSRQKRPLENRQKPVGGTRFAPS